MTLVSSFPSESARSGGRRARATLRDGGDPPRSPAASDGETARPYLATSVSARVRRERVRSRARRDERRARGRRGRQPGESASHAATNSTVGMLVKKDAEKERRVCAAVAVPRGDAGGARGAGLVVPDVALVAARVQGPLAARHPRSGRGADADAPRGRRRASCRLAHPVDVSVTDRRVKPGARARPRRRGARHAPLAVPERAAARDPPAAGGAPARRADRRREGERRRHRLISSRGLVPRCAPRGRATPNRRRVYLEELAGFWP